MKKEKRSSQAGFAMIEVLASVLILAFCLLSIAGLLVFTQKSNTSSYVKQQAIQSTADIIELMNANRAAAIAGSYAMSNLGGAAPSAPSPNCTTGTCNGSQLAAWDLYEWQTRLAQFGGSGQIVMTAASGLLSPETGAVAAITVEWNDSPAQAVLGSATSTTTQINGANAAANLGVVQIASQISQ